MEPWRGRSPPGCDQAAEVVRHEDELQGECPRHTTARVALATTLALLPAATHVVLMAPLHGWKSLLCEGPLAALNLVTAARTLALRTKEADHATYTLHTVWFSALLGSSLVVL